MKFNYFKVIIGYFLLVTNLSPSGISRLFAKGSIVIAIGKDVDRIKATSERLAEKVHGA